MQLSREDFQFLQMWILRQVSTALLVPSFYIFLLLTVSLLVPPLSHATKGRAGNGYYPELLAKGGDLSIESLRALEDSGELPDVVVHRLEKDKKKLNKSWWGMGAGRHRRDALNSFSWLLGHYGKDNSSQPEISLKAALADAVTLAKTGHPDALNLVSAFEHPDFTSRSETWSSLLNPPKRLYHSIFERKKQRLQRIGRVSGNLAKNPMYEINAAKALRRHSESGSSSNKVKWASLVLLGIMGGAMLPGAVGMPLGTVPGNIIRSDDASISRFPRDTCQICPAVSTSHSDVNYQIKPVCGPSGTTCRGGYTQAGFECPCIPSTYVRSTDQVTDQGYTGQALEFCPGDSLELRVPGISKMSPMTAFQVHGNYGGDSYACPANTTASKYGGGCLIKPCGPSLDANGLHLVAEQPNPDLWIARITPTSGFTIAYVDVFSCLPYECDNIDTCSFSRTTLTMHLKKYAPIVFQPPVKPISQRPDTYGVAVLKPEGYNELITTRITREGNKTTTGHPSTQYVDYYQKTLVQQLGLGEYQFKGGSVVPKDLPFCPIDMDKPVRLLAETPEYTEVQQNLKETVFSWTVDTDLPIDHFELTNATDPEQPELLQPATATSVALSHEGTAEPAPTVLEYEHKTVYQGLSDQKNPVQTLTLNFTDYLPQNVSIEDLEHVSFKLTWAPPTESPDQVSEYRLIMTDAKNGTTETLDFTLEGSGSGSCAEGSTNGNGSDMHCELVPRKFSNGMADLLQLSAVYSEDGAEKGDEWWGPAEVIDLRAPATSHTPTPAGTSATSNRVLRSSPHATPSNSHLLTATPLSPTDTPSPSVIPASGLGPVAIVGIVGGAGGGCCLLTILSGVVVKIYLKLREKMKQQQGQEPSEQRDAVPV